MSNQVLNTTKKAIVNEVLNLAKTAPGVNIQEIGISWNPNLAKSNNKDVDVDLFAAISDMNGKNVTAANVFFYNNVNGKNDESKDIYPDSMSREDMIKLARQMAETCPVVITRDNRTGAGDGDDEIMFINRSLLKDGQKVNIGMNIHEAEKEGLNFTMVDDCQVNVYNEDKTVAINYDLGMEYSREQGIVVAEIFMFKGEPQFKAVGTPFKGDVNDFMNLFK